MVRARRTGDALVGAPGCRRGLRRSSRDAVRLEAASVGHDRAGATGASPLASPARGSRGRRQVAPGGAQDAGGGARRSDKPPRSTRATGWLRIPLPASAAAGAGSRGPGACAAAALVRKGVHGRGGGGVLAWGGGQGGEADRDNAVVHRRREPG